VRDRGAFLILFICLAFTFNVGAREIDLIDCPTADVLIKRNFRIITRVFHRGGLLLQGQLGLFERFSLGISCGGTDVISDTDPLWNPRMEFMVRYRLIDEDIIIPAVALGFESQGHGNFSGLHNRYDSKSKGLYAVATKGFARLMGLRAHFGINYNNYEGDNGENSNDSDDSTSENAAKPSYLRNGNHEDETNDDLQSLNAFAAVDFAFNPQVMGIIEYDVANNDNRRDDLYGDGGGYLNAGVRWRISREFLCDFGFRDLLGTAGKNSRYLSLSYENKF